MGCEGVMAQWMLKKIYVAETGVSVRAKTRWHQAALFVSILDPALQAQSPSLASCFRVRADWVGHFLLVAEIR